DDGGNTWIHIDAGITFPEDTDGVDNDGKDGPDEIGEGIRLEQRIKLTASPTVPGLMYAGFISATGQLNGLFQSTDGGDSWLRLRVPVGYTPPTLSGGVHFSIVADAASAPDQRTAVYVGAGGLTPYRIS